MITSFLCWVVVPYIFVVIVWYTFYTVELTDSLKRVKVNEDLKASGACDYSRAKHTLRQEQAVYYLAQSKRSWYWPIACIISFVKRNRAIKQEVNKFAADLLIKKLDDTLAAQRKQQKLEEKAKEAKEKFDLLKKEMAQ